MQFKPIKVADIELGDPIKHITGLEGYAKLKALVRYHGRPMGWISVPVYCDRCLAEEIRRKILDSAQQCNSGSSSAQGLDEADRSGGPGIRQINKNAAL